MELGEIEAAFRTAPQVGDVAVILREDQPGEKLLVGYAPRGENVDTSALHRHLSQILPKYMVPAATVILGSLPLTLNGKLDRQALPAPNHTYDGYRAPRTSQEEVLCELFSEVLGVDSAGIDGDFFQLGGHSLLATRLVSRIRSTLGVEISIRTLFESPTVGELSERLLNKESGVPFERSVRPPRLPLSYAQQRLWFIDRLEGNSTAYNVPEAFRLEGKLDRDALENAINTIVERHESLRTNFEEINGEAVQVIDPFCWIKIPVAT